MIHASIYFAGAARGGIASLIAALRDAGATRLGAEECVRVPIDHALATEWLNYATHIDVANGAGFTARVTCAECVGINARWQHGTEADVTPLVERLSAARELDFAVAVVGDLDVHATAVDEARRARIALCPPAVYRRNGPLGCGDRTWIGARVAALLPDPGRVSTERPLVVAAEQREDVQAIFASEGVFARTEMRGRLPANRPGSRWQPPPAVARASQPSEEAARIVARLQETDRTEETLGGIEAPDLVAPFASLRRIRAAGFEAERAVLAFAHLDDSQLDDAGLVGADLRGACVRGARWVEVSLADADLRWADLSGAELPLAILEGANCAEADFRGARLERACFDRAVLRGAAFDGADLTGARFVGADLTGASFRGAKTGGVNLAGARLAGTGLEGG